MTDKEVNVKENSLIISHHSFFDLHSPVGAKHPNVPHQYLSKKSWQQFSSISYYQNSQPGCYKQLTKDASASAMDNGCAEESL